MDGQLDVWMDEQTDVHASPHICRQTATQSSYMDTEHWVDRQSRRSQTETAGDAGMILLEFSLVEDCLCTCSMHEADLLYCVWFISNEQL